MSSVRGTMIKDLTQPTPGRRKERCVELIQSLHSEVLQTLLAKNSSANVKKAALCLFRLVWTSAKVISGREFAPHLAQLWQDRHLGVLTSAMSLLYGLASQTPGDYESIIPHAVHILGMLVLKKACAREYLYCRTQSPWLQIK